MLLEVGRDRFPDPLLGRRSRPSGSGPSSIFWSVSGRPAISQLTASRSKSSSERRRQASSTEAAALDGPWPILRIVHRLSDSRRTSVLPSSSRYSTVAAFSRGGLFLRFGHRSSLAGTRSPRSLVVVGRPAAARLRSRGPPLLLEPALARGAGRPGRPPPPRDPQAGRDLRRQALAAPARGCGPGRARPGRRR